MITYAEVAATIRPEIREAIEVSAPCVGAADRQHLWCPERSEVRSWSDIRTYRVDEWWECEYCVVVARTNPIAPELRDLHVRLLGPEADDPWWTS